MPNNSDRITVRLRKDVKAYGRRGALVPVSPGAMRNLWFPGGIAEYVTAPELKVLRLSNVGMERDFEFDDKPPRRKRLSRTEANQIWQKDIPTDIQGMSTTSLQVESVRERAKMMAGVTRSMEVERLTPQRSTELVELFVPPRLEFYRQAIIEEKEPEKPVPLRPQVGGAAGDLLVARAPTPEKVTERAQAIYGSVSVQDVLIAVRAVMSENDEAARVVLHESEIQLVDVARGEGSEAGKVKHLGDFAVEIRVRGSQKTVMRSVRVLPQEAGSSGT